MGKSKKMSLATKLFITGVLFLVASVVVMVLGGAIGTIPWAAANSRGTQWGIVPSTGWLWGALFDIDLGLTGSGRIYWGNTDIWRFFVVVIVYAGLILTLVSIVVSLKGKQWGKVLETVVLYIAVLFGAYLFISVYIPVSYQMLWRCSYAWYVIIIVLNLVSIVLLSIPALIGASKVVSAVANEGKKEEPVAEPVEEEIEEEEEPLIAGLSEEEVRKIVEEAVAAHVDEKHVAGETVVEKVEEEPAAEEEIEEEAEEEEEEEAEVTTDGVASKFPTKSKRRKASFETRLKKSDEELRHQYYELRDYIKSYGIKNRISIPGDTFSAHRERYAFITINGKHIKAYFALNPADYAGGTIPVETIDSKKYEDLPCMLRIKSGLSLRRAMKLVDDVMAAKGVTKEETK